MAERRPVSVVSGVRQEVGNTDNLPPEIVPRALQIIAIPRGTAVSVGEHADIVIPKWAASMTFTGFHAKHTGVGTGSGSTTFSLLDEEDSDAAVFTAAPTIATGQKGTHHAGGSAGTIDGAKDNPAAYDTWKLKVLTIPDGTAPQGLIVTLEFE